MRRVLVAPGHSAGYHPTMRFAREGWPFVLPFVALAAVVGLLGSFWGTSLCLLLAIAVLLFFRDPPRRFEGGPELLLAAADGIVTGVDEIEEPALGPGRFKRVITFLSAFDVHVQRLPASGTVIESTYRPGRKIAAFLAHADRVNQWHLAVIERPNGDRIGVRQIAGLLARRVVCHLREGQAVERGDHLGLIKFGSRVDLLVPCTYEVLVAEGQRLRNGETPVARECEAP